MGAIGFQLDLIQALTVFPNFDFDGVAALRTLALLGFELLDALAALASLFGKGIDLGIDLGACGLEDPCLVNG